eukprot:132186-Prorocentrum_minimum.AAC.2
MRSPTLVLTLREDPSSAMERDNSLCDVPTSLVRVPGVDAGAGGGDDGVDAGADGGDDGERGGALHSQLAPSAAHAGGEHPRPRPVHRQRERDGRQILQVPPLDPL